MSATVREFNQHFIDLWWECDTSLPDLGPLYTPSTQTQNEKHLLQFLEQVERMLSNPPRSRARIDPRGVLASRLDFVGGARTHNSRARDS